MLLRDMPYSQNWRGSELAIALDDGRPFIFSGLRVWPEAEGAAAGAHMIIVRQPDDTFACTVSGTSPIVFSSITSEQANVLLGNSSIPKYLPVSRLYFGEHEMRIPVPQEFRCSPKSCCITAQSSRS